MTDISQIRLLNHEANQFILKLPKSKARPIVEALVDIARRVRNVKVGDNHRFYSIIKALSADRGVRFIDQWGTKEEREKYASGILTSTGNQVVKKWVIVLLDFIAQYDPKEIFIFFEKYKIPFSTDIDNSSWQLLDPVTSKPIQLPKWPPALSQALKAKRLGLLIGNGASRLFGTPSWSEFLKSEETILLYEEAGINWENENLVTLATFLKDQNPILFGQIKSSFQRQLKTLQRKNIPLTHQIISKYFLSQTTSQNKASILTTNFDDLLEVSGISRDAIGYLHGNPSDRDTWVLTLDEYYKNQHNSKLTSEINKLDADAILFIGYGHNIEDFDIAGTISAISQVDKQDEIFSLVPNTEAKDGIKASILRSCGVASVNYPTPSNPTLVERDAWLAHTLLGLLQEANPSIVDETFLQIAEVVGEGVEESLSRRANASVAIGLAARNKHLILERDIPSGGHRTTMKADVYNDIGGPALIVSAFAKAVGIDTYLTTYLCNDQNGKSVKSYLEKHDEDLNAQVFTDFVFETSLNPKPRGLRTWSSTFVQPTNTTEAKHRVVIDTWIDRNELALSHDLRKSLIDYVHSGNDLVVYFDKFLKADVPFVLNPPEGSLPENVWTVYETGTAGDRASGYQKSKPNIYDDSKAYRFEENLKSDNFSFINVLASSFRFARDYLAFRDMNEEQAHYLEKRSTYSKLVHKHDNKDILDIALPSGGKMTKGEDEIIADMLANEKVLKSYCDYVKIGAQNFLRKDHFLRIVTVTLHDQGCLVINADPKSTWQPLHVQGVSVSATEYTSSAGDVFRAALVSALTYCQKIGLANEIVVSELFWKITGSLCNECAAKKVENPTVLETMPKIIPIFEEWKERLHSHFS